VPGNGYILLVEDNPDDELLTVRALRSNNVANEVIVAHDGEEAINLLLGEPGAETPPLSRPSVILLDLKLPKIDGIGVLQRLRAEERTKLIPVVILTSSREEEDVINGYRSGANGYVRKPVDFVEFTEAVKTLGVFWLLLNEPPPTR
jgi:CheY-like chemotaxis protein